MPELPRYTARRGLSTIDLPRASAGAFQGNDLSGLANLSGGIANQIDQRQEVQQRQAEAKAEQAAREAKAEAARQKEIDDNLWLTRQTTDINRKMIEAREQAKMQISPDGTGFAQNLDQHYQQSLASIYQEADQRGPEVRARAEAIFGQHGNEFLNQNLTIENAQKTSFRTAGLEESLNNLSQGVNAGGDTSQARALAAAVFTQAATFLPPDDLVRLKNKFQQDITLASYQAQIARDPKAALIALQNGGQAAGGKMFEATPGLLASVEAQESNGNQSSVSPKNAIGVMQLLPDTAKEAARDLGIPFDEKRLREDVNYNRELGAAYLNKQLQKYQGEPVLALAAYNAGPGQVDEWIKQFGDPRKGEISAEDFAQKIPYQETKQYVSQILRQSSSDPSLAALPPEERRRLQAQAEQGVVQSQALKRIEVAQQLQDAQAAAEDGRDPFRYVLITDIRQAFDAPEADARITQLQRQSTLGLEIKSLATKSNQEIEAIIADAQPKEGEGDYAYKAQRFDALAKEGVRIEKDRTEQEAAAQKIAKERDDDPAAFTIRHFDNIAQAFAEADNDPRKLSQAVSQSLELQRQVGVPEAKRRALPKDYAANEVAAFQSLPAEKAADRLASLQAQFGAAWPAVFKDLSQAGLPDFTIVLGAADRSDQAQFRQALIEANRMGKSQLENLIPTSARTQLSQQVDLELDEFIRTLPPRQAALYRNAIEQVASFNAAKGKDVEQAAHEAARDILKNYSIHDGYRVPVAFDGEKVAAGLEQIKGNLDKYNILVPGSNNPNLHETYRKEQTLVALAARGRWLTNEDESGVYLAYPNGVPVQIVSSKSGRPRILEIKFTEAQGLPPSRSSIG